MFEASRNVLSVRVASKVEAEMFPKLSIPSIKRKNFHACTKFDVEVVDTESWSEKLRASDQENEDFSLEPLRVSTKDILDRIQYSKGEIPNYEKLGQGSRIFSF